MKVIAVLKVTVSSSLITRYLKLFLAAVYLLRNGIIMYKQYCQKYLQLNV